MLKKILFALMFAIVATVTHAESDLKTVASKAYVDTMVETRQDKIPAANQPNVGAGETVMTYTAAGNGAIGERGIYTGANAYNANTDAEKLITASALNDTFTNLPTTGTTKLQCANLNDGCTLWTIVDQTAYGKSRNLLNPANIHQGTLNASGEWVYSSARCYFDYIPVKQGDLVWFTSKKNTPPVHSQIWIYSDTNESSFISPRLNANQSVTFEDYTGYKFIIPSDGYVRGLFLQNDSFTPADIVDAQVVIQSTAPIEYEPY